MVEVIVNLKSFEDGEKLCRLASKQDFPVDLVLGNRAADAKSIEGIYALGIGKDIVLRANVASADGFVNALVDLGLCQYR